MTLRDEDDSGDPPTRDLKRPLRLVQSPTTTPRRDPAAKRDLDAPDEAYTKALSDPDEPSAA